jgi:hypothetical protein
MPLQLAIPRSNLYTTARFPSREAVGMRDGPVDTAGTPANTRSWRISGLSRVAPSDLNSLGGGSSAQSVGSVRGRADLSALCASINPLPSSSSFWSSSAPEDSIGPRHAPAFLAEQ